MVTGIQKAFSFIKGVIFTILGVLSALLIMLLMFGDTKAVNKAVNSMSAKNWGR